MAERNVGGITGKGGKNVNKVYKDSGAHVKVIAAGSKPLTRPKVPFSAQAPRSQADIRRMGGGGIGGPMGIKNK